MARPCTVVVAFRFSLLNVIPRTMKVSLQGQFLDIMFPPTMSRQLTGLPGIYRILSGFDQFLARCLVALHSFNVYITIRDGAGAMASIVTNVLTRAELHVF